VSRRTLWLLLLLLPQPPLSLAYLMAIRARQIEPSFLPPLVLALAPLAAAIGSAATLLRERNAPRTRLWILLVAGVAELLWAVLTLAMVGFAIAWRSG
jgi:drug/metabolite transporter (DMT)-like permease